MKVRAGTLVCLSGAVISVAVLVSRHPQHSRTRLARAAFREFTASVEDGQWEAAERQLQRALDEYPGHPHYLGCLGWLRSVRAARERYWTGLACEGELRRELDPVLVARAKDAYRATLAANAMDDGVHHNLAWLCHLTGERSEADLHLSRAAAIDPAMALYRVTAGLWREAARAAAPEAEYSRALALDPSLAASPFFAELRSRAPGLAAASLSLAVEFLEREAGADGSPIVSARLGALALAQGRLEAAHERLRSANARAPALPAVWYNLGVLADLRGDTPAAARALHQRAASFNAADYRALSWLASDAERQDRPAEARRLYLRAIRSRLQAGSPRADRLRGLYASPVVLTDDVFPRGFLAYCQPALDVALTYRRAAALYARDADQDAVRYCEDAAARWVRAHPPCPASSFDAGDANRPHPSDR